MSRDPSRASKAAPAAGGGSPGTTQSGAADRAVEADELAAIAEALTPPGGSVGEVLDAERDGRDDGTVEALRVRALPEAGFRRAGRNWPSTPVDVPVDDLSFEQIDALMNEPMLHVTLIGQAEGE